MLAELARIRKEREHEAAKKAAEEEKTKQLAMQEEVMHGNPLAFRAQPDFQVCVLKMRMPGLMDRYVTGCTFLFGDSQQVPYQHGKACLAVTL